MHYNVPYCNAHIDAPLNRMCSKSCVSEIQCALKLSAPFMVLEDNCEEGDETLIEDVIEVAS